MHQGKGIFEQANVALTCWVNEGAIFILLRVTRALAKNTENMPNSLRQLTKKQKFNALVHPNNRDSESTHFSRYCTISRGSPRPGAFGRLDRSNRNHQRAYLGSTAHRRCIGLAAAQRTLPCPKPR